MDIIKNTAGVVAFSATGALLGTAVDVIAGQVFANTKVTSLPTRAVLQLSAGVIVLSSATSGLASLLGGMELDDFVATIPFMAVFFLQAQPGLKAYTEFSVLEIAAAIEGMIKKDFSGNKNAAPSDDDEDEY